MLEGFCAYTAFLMIFMVLKIYVSDYSPRRIFLFAGAAMEKAHQWIGVTQLIWVVPTVLLAMGWRRPGFSKGVIIAAALVLLLSSFCYWIFR